MPLTELHLKNVSFSTSNAEKHPNRTLESSNNVRLKTKNPPNWGIPSPCFGKVLIKSTDNQVEIEGALWVAGRFLA